jgi:hypothetical protein
VEGNYHFLEFPAPKRHAASCVVELGKAIQSASAKSDSALAGAALRKDAAQPERLVDRGAMLAAKLGEAGRQERRRRALGPPARREAIERQVRLYCFRLGNCGTFMPLFCVRGISKIAVVWTLSVAAFSAVAPVHFSILSTRAAVLSAVDCR